MASNVERSLTKEEKEEVEGVKKEETEEKVEEKGEGKVSSSFEISSHLSAADAITFLSNRRRDFEGKEELWVEEDVADGDEIWACGGSGKSANVNDDDDFVESEEWPPLLEGKRDEQNVQKTKEEEGKEGRKLRMRRSIKCERETGRKPRRHDIFDVGEARMKREMDRSNQSVSELRETRENRRGEYRNDGESRRGGNNGEGRRICESYGGERRRVGNLHTAGGGNRGGDSDEERREEEEGNDGNVEFSASSFIIFLRKVLFIIYKFPLVHQIRSLLKMFKKGCRYFQECFQPILWWFISYPLPLCLIACLTTIIALFWAIFLYYILYWCLIPPKLRVFPVYFDYNYYGDQIRRTPEAAMSSQYPSTAAPPPTSQFASPPHFHHPFYYYPYPSPPFPSYPSSPYISPSSAPSSSSFPGSSSPHPSSVDTATLSSSSIWDVTAAAVSGVESNSAGAPDVSSHQSTNSAIPPNYPSPHSPPPVSRPSVSSTASPSSPYIPSSFSHPPYFPLVLFPFPIPYAPPSFSFSDEMFSRFCSAGRSLSSATAIVRFNNRSWEFTPTPTPKHQYFRFSSVNQSHHDESSQSSFTSFPYSPSSSAASFSSPPPTNSLLFSKPPLRLGFVFDIIVRLKYPNTPHNLAAPPVMFVLELLSQNHTRIAKSIRPYVTYQHYQLVEWLRAMLLALPNLLGMLDDTTYVKLLCFENFPFESQDMLSYSYITMSPALHVQNVELIFESQLQGFRWYMREWPWISAFLFCCISVCCCSTCANIFCCSLYLQIRGGNNNSEDGDAPPPPPPPPSSSLRRMSFASAKLSDSGSRNDVEEQKMWKCPSSPSSASFCSVSDNNNNVTPRCSSSSRHTNITSNLAFVASSALGRVSDSQPRQRKRTNPPAFVEKLRLHNNSQEEWKIEVD